MILDDTPTNPLQEISVDTGLEPAPDTMAELVPELAPAQFDAPAPEPEPTDQPLQEPAGAVADAGASLTETTVRPQPVQALPAVAKEVLDTPSAGAEHALDASGLFGAAAPSAAQGNPAGTPDDEPGMQEDGSNRLDYGNAGPRSLPGGDTQDQARAYWNTVLTGNLDTVPADVRAQAGCDDLSMDAEEQDYMLAQTINRSWAVDNLGISPEDALAHWPVHRRKLADELKVADDEREVFCGLNIRQSDTTRREVARRIYERSYRAGLMGEDYTDDTEGLAMLEESDRAAADALGVHAYQEGADLRARWLPLVERTARGIDFFAGMEEEEAIISPRVFSTAPDLAAVLDRLCELKEEDLELVIGLAADMARKMRRSGSPDESTASRMGRATRRGITNMVLNSTQTADNLGAFLTRKAGKMVGGDTGRALRREAENWDRRSRMAYRLRNMSQQEISPLYVPVDSGKVESYFMDAAEALPTALLAFCGPYGVTGITIGSIGHSVAEARARAPLGDQDLQLYAGVTAGVLQGGIYMGMTRVGGKMLENTISTFMKSRGAGAAAFTMNGLKTAGALSVHGAELMAAGKLADATGLGAQELAARCSGTASNIDWKNYGENQLDIQVNMHEAAALLPFLLIGSGRATLRHFRAPESLLGDGTVLVKDWGIDEQTARSIMEEKDIDTKNTRLEDALRRSSRWHKNYFLPDIVRSMALLNEENFTDFKQIDVIRDFLRIPSEVSQAKDPQPIVRSVDEAISSPELHHEYRAENNKSGEHFEDALRLWDEWRQKSYMDKAAGSYFQDVIDKSLYDSPSAERSVAYQYILREKEGTVPNRMRNSGIFAPMGEVERRAMLRDTVKETVALSHRFMMSAYPLEALVRNIFPAYRTAKRAEMSRKRMVGQVARAVISMSMGTKPQLAFDELYRAMGIYLVNRGYRGTFPRWIREVGPGKLLSIRNHVDNTESSIIGGPAEYREVLRVANGFTACAYRLVNLLPMTSDFTTSLSRGMSPAQAYHHLLLRELEYVPEKVNNYPMAEIEKSGGAETLELLNKDASGACDIYRKLTGGTVESTTAEDGTPHWRFRLPDGNYTRWHGREQEAMNDLYLNLAPYFSPMGDKYFRWLRYHSPRRKFDPTQPPVASFRQFSGFDNLAAIALKELKQHLHESPTRTMPGHSFERLRKYYAVPSGGDPLRVRVGGDVAPLPGGEMVVDSFSVTTPYSLMESRFLVYWKRMLDSNFIPAETVSDFLEQQGLLDAKSREKLEKMAIAPRFPKNPDTPLKFTPPANIGGRNMELARRMSRFHTIHFFADLENRNVPESLRAWFRMLPFCPDLEEKEYAAPATPHVSLRIPYGEDGRVALAWSNRVTSMKLRAMAGDFERMRGVIKDGALPENGIAELIRLGNDGSPAQRYEQGWCFHTGGPGVFRNTPQYMWNLLLFPKRGWKAMSPKEKADLGTRLLSLASTDPAPGALDAVGRGESVDYVEQAVLQLDDVMQRFPEIHRYAPVPGSEDRVYELDLNDSLVEGDHATYPQLDAEALYTEDRIAGQPMTQTEVLLPPEIRNSPEAVQSIRFLSALRATASHRPYYLNNTIWWNHSPYGGLRGQHPRGLLDWEVSAPAETVFQLLNNIDSLCKSQGSETLDICKVPVRGADWTLEDFEDLRATTVYRWPRNNARVYRLMPGYPNSSLMEARTPYFVLCHRGMYIGDAGLIRKAEDFNQSYCPLEYFASKQLREISQGGLTEGRGVSLEHTLNALEQWPDHREELLENPSSCVHGLEELFLRLCEDTCFSRSIDPGKPEALTPEQAHVVNVARAVLSCLYHNNSPAALQSLREAIRPLADNPQLRADVIDVLNSASDEAELVSTKSFEKHLQYRDVFRDLLEQSKEQMRKERQMEARKPATRPAKPAAAPEPLKQLKLGLQQPGRDASAPVPRTPPAEASGTAGAGEGGEVLTLTAEPPDPPRHGRTKGAKDLKPRKRRGGKEEEGDDGIQPPLLPLGE